MACLAGLPLSTSHTFLIVDTDEESRLLFSRTLLRKFPDAGLLEARTLDSALDIVAAPAARPPSAIVVHRAFGAEGPEAVAQLRAKLPQVPIVMVSSTNREAEALSAGADDFILTAEWLRIGPVVSSLLKQAREGAEN